MSKLYATIFSFASVREKICVKLNFVTERIVKNQGIRIKLPFVKGDCIHDSPRKIGVMQALADEAGGEKETDSACRPLACSRYVTRQWERRKEKTQRDAQLSGRMERATQWLPVHKPKIATSTSCQIQNSKRTESKLLLLKRSIRVSVCRNCNSTTVFGSIKSYSSCRTFQEPPTM